MRPPPSDEGPHRPGSEPLWSESWYFDAVSDDGSLGLYLRIGRTPGSRALTIGACVLRPGAPAVLLVEELPLQAVATDLTRIEAPGTCAELDCAEPLKRFEASVSGTGAAHADHSAPLRGEPGEPVSISIEGTWTTDGLPYMWRRSTRYEIPCRVEGTVGVGGTEVAFAGCGQRDHSWGVRDWWGSDWVWSALHLEDGTHVHAVAVPEHPRFAVGYVQRAGVLEEVRRVSTRTELSADGLVEGATISVSPPDLEIGLDPLGFGAVLLVAADGRSSHFPRALCRVRASDGRSGLGWVEWNRNQRTETAVPIEANS